MDHAPTKERTRHGTVEPGFYQRQAHRAITQMEDTLRRQDIDPEQYQAGLKFEKHYHGMMGIDVRRGDTTTPDPIEYPKFYHGEKIWHAAGALSSPDQYEAVRAFVIDDTPLVGIGRTIRPGVSHPVARATGLTAISVALDVLCYHWGIKTKPQCHIRRHYDPGRQG